MICYRALNCSMNCHNNCCTEEDRQHGQSKRPAPNKSTTEIDTHIDDVGDISALQVMENTSFVQVGQQGHVGTHLEFRGVHRLAVVDVHGSFLRGES